MDDKSEYPSLTTGFKTHGIRFLDHIRNSPLSIPRSYLVVFVYSVGIVLLGIDPSENLW